MLALLTYRVLLAVLKRIGGDTDPFPDLPVLGRAFLDDVWELEIEAIERRKRNGGRGGDGEWHGWNS